MNLIELKGYIIKIQKEIKEAKEDDTPDFSILILGGIKETIKAIDEDCPNVRLNKEFQEIMRLLKGDEE